MNRAEILTTARDLTMGERNVQHGHPRVNLTNIASLWSGYFGDPTMFDAHDVAVMMVLLKMARTKTGATNPDDYVDAAAYAAIAGEIAMMLEPKQGS